MMAAVLVVALSRWTGRRRARQRYLHRCLATSPDEVIDSAPRKCRRHIGDFLLTMSPHSLLPWIRFSWLSWTDHLLHLCPCNSFALLCDVLNSVLPPYQAVTPTTLTFLSLHQCRLMVLHLQQLRSSLSRHHPNSQYTSGYVSPQTF